jgi:hypothetical protein
MQNRIVPILTAGRSCSLLTNGKRPSDIQSIRSTMPKLLTTLIAWEYPSEDEPLSASVWDLQDQDNLMGWYITLANGIILELKIEGDTQEALNVVRGMLRGVGSAKPVTLSKTEKENLWLFEEGLESYQQGIGKTPGYIFLNPVPQPRKFD